MSKQAYHGGAFFEAIGEDFSTLEKSKTVISADVLDAWFDPSPKVIKKINKYLNFAIRTSPPTQCNGLIKAISKSRGINKRNIIVNGGSSDIMFSIIPKLAKKNSKALILDPMYGEYAHIFENVSKSKLIRHKLSKNNNFVVDFENLKKDILENKPKIVVLVNPNSPTGKFCASKKILNLIDTTSKEVLFLVDETYIEYVGKQNSLEKEASKRDNLIIIKSMSKAYALSGARVAYMVANKKRIEQLSCFIPPWSVSLLGQIAGVEALKDEKYYKNKYNETHDLLKIFINELSEIKGIKIYDSVANFFLIELINKKFSAKKIVENLKKENIYLRNCDSMSQQFDDNFIRIAIKDKKTNHTIAAALKKQFSEIKL